jgi:hypothetical protein
MNRGLGLSGVVMAVAVALVPACGGTGPSSSSGQGFTILVTFNHRNDCGGGKVDHVRATAPDGGIPQMLVPCVSGTPVIIPYANAAAMTYPRFLVEGREPTPAGTDEQTTWFGRQDLTVAAGPTHQFVFDLQPAGPEVIANFSFGTATSAGMAMTCDEAGVTKVHVDIDKGTSAALAADLKCKDASAGDRAAITGIPVGTHDFDFTASDANGTVIFEALVPGEAVIQNQNNNFNVNLKGTQPGSLQLRWSFAAATGMGCMEANVTQIQYTVVPPAGSATSHTAACADPMTGANGSATIPGLDAGIYAISSIVGIDSASGQATFGATTTASLFVVPGKVNAYPVTLMPK